MLFPLFTFVTGKGGPGGLEIIFYLFCIFNILLVWKGDYVVGLRVIRWKVPEPLQRS